MQKIKNIIKRFFKPNGIIYRGIKKIYTPLSTVKFKLTNSKEIKKQNKHFDDQVCKAVEILNGYNSKEYVVFFNPTWLGVANSTKGLFENIVPLEQVFGNKNIKKIAEAVVNNNIKTAIFSQIVDGWIDVIKEIKKMNNDINIKVIWHGNCYEYFSDYTWNLNKEVMTLYKEGKITSFGFVRSIMYEFYKKVGFKSYYLQNNVNLKDIEIIDKKSSKYLEKKNLNKIKVGIYNADSRELKNIYTALSAIKLLGNGIADVVPINSGAKEFCSIIELETESIDGYIPTKELLERIQYNDINIYPTFTENAPMFPIESFDVGIPCLVGNNNDYFVGTKLGGFVILEREDDPVYIKQRIEYCNENKEEIMNLYKEWKKEFNKKCKNWVKEFSNS